VAAIDEGPRDRELLALLYDGLGAARSLERCVAWV
jgi:hypothetical protein